MAARRTNQNGRLVRGTRRGGGWDWATRLLSRGLLLWNADRSAVGSRLSTCRYTAAASDSALRNGVSFECGRDSVRAPAARLVARATHQALYLELPGFSICDGDDPSGGAI